MLACANGHAEVVRELLQHDTVDRNAQLYSGAASLFMASQNGDVVVIRALLRHDDVDVNSHRDSGAAALHVASERASASYSDTKMWK